MLALLLVLATQADREAEMFGSEDDAPPPAQTPPDAAATRDDLIFGSHEAAPTQDRSLLEEAAEALDVGGQIFLRTNAAWSQDAAIGDMVLTAPSLLDAFMDVRPTDRTRGFAQVRFTYDYTVSVGETDFLGRPLQQFTLLLDQAWLKFDLGRVAFITAGRQRIRWGTGRFWNPTDFINADIRNSLDFFDVRTGVDLFKVHFPFEALGWNLYLLAVLPGIDTLDDTGVAARFEMLLGQMEIALSSMVKQDAPLRFGADASFGLWLFDLRAEGTVQRGLEVRKFGGDIDLRNGVFPVEQDTSDRWFFRGVFGGDIQLKYTDEDSFILGGEYFYNQAGYDSAVFYPFLALNGAFTPFYLGQHYGAAYIALPGPFTWNDATFTLSTLANFSDLSAVSRLDFALVYLNSITFNAFAAVHYGARGEMRLGLEIPPQPQIPGLEEGFVLPTQMLDLGVALRIAL